jgi:hypothetical protein
MLVARAEDHVLHTMFQNLFELREHVGRGPGGYESMVRESMSVPRFRNVKSVVALGPWPEVVRRWRIQLRGFVRWHGASGNEFAGVRASRRLECPAPQGATAFRK